MTWGPKDDWQPLTSGTGQANGGVWVTGDGWVVKRLLPGVEDVRHHAYWQRQALVAESGLVARTPGLRTPEYIRVVRDAEGISLWSEYVQSAVVDPLALARALGRFAQARVVEPAWGARDVLRDRLRTVERRGGWTALSRVVDEPLWWTALSYLLLATDLPLSSLLDAHGADSAVRRGAVLTAAFTAVSRAAWSLDQEARGDHVERMVSVGDVIEEASGQAA